MTGKPTHGHCVNRAHSPTYTSWHMMIGRCKLGREYSHLGTTVCERWRTSFTNFLADMGERPAGHEIDRVDPTGNYEPGNCRWTLVTINRRYRRTTKLTKEVRALILSLHQQGKSGRHIAKSMGLGKSTVAAFLNGTSWARD